MIDACPLCAAPLPQPFLVRASVPVHQNRTAATATAARAMPRGRLDMVACETCGFVCNRAFDPGLLHYGPGYDNTQSHSPAFAAHLDALARHLLDQRGVRGARIVEVGCGQGEFLRRLVADPGGGNSGVGFDPAYAGEAGGGALRFVRDFFGPGSAEPADVVVCRHVIEHVADPLALLRTIRAALSDAPQARVFFETPDVSWIFRNAVLWDLFYEHCSLFAAGSLADACARAGFRVTEVRRVFGGQYLWLEASLGAPRARPNPDGIAAQARAYAVQEAAAAGAWQRRVAEGRLAVWGAGAKGATFASLADPDAARIDCFVDINPAKQGRFLPGTGHPIVAPAALAGRDVARVLAMNPQYCMEIMPLLPHGMALAVWAD